LLALAQRVADEVETGMIVGLGSGSTAEAVVRELGRREAHGIRLTGVPTSARTAELARAVGIPLMTLDQIAESGETIALGIDGADEIDPVLNATKGRGGALLYEKLVALACQRWVLVAATEKLVPQLGTRLPLPVEIVPFGWQLTLQRLKALGLRPVLRRAGAKGLPPSPDAPTFVTDGGHFIVDCETGPMDDPERLATAIKGLTGVVEHGLFLGLAGAAYLASPDGTIHVATPAR
jgi:ribose 5-phosphate isomerase A